MKILITGISGFIGFALAKELKRQGYEVTGLVRKNSSLKKLEDEKISYVIGDLLEPESLKSALNDKDIVVHCAGFVSDWGEKQDFINGNTIASENLFEACLDFPLKRMIHVSTVDIFGSRNNAVIDEDSDYGKGAEWYARSKTVAEKKAREYMESKALPITIVYPSWVYGEGDSHLIPELVPAIKNRSMVFMRNKGNHVIELNYIGNLVDAVIHLINTPDAVYKRYILSDEPKVLFRDFVNSIAGQIGKKEVRLSMPYWLAYSVGFLMEKVWKILGIKKRPLLTRHAVSLLGNNIFYKTENLKKTGFQQRYFYPETLKKAVNFFLNKGS